MTIKLVLVTALLLSIIIPFGTFLYSKKTKGGYKAALGFNIFAFFSILIVSNIMMFTGKVSAAEATAAAASATDGWKFMAAALSTGLSAALGAISEDSSIMGKSLIFVAMAEGVCLYGLIISLMILS